MSSKGRAICFIHSQIIYRAPAVYMALKPCGMNLKSASGMNCMGDVEVVGLESPSWLPN